MRLVFACIAISAGSPVWGQTWQGPGVGPAPAQLTPASAEVAWPVPIRSFERGEILTEQDFASQQIAGRSVIGLAPFDALVGKAAARPIQAGTALRLSDVMEPQLVYRGAPVKVHLRIDGIDIVSSGRALSDGQFGKTVRVFSNVSSRTLDAIVEGPGVVHIAGY